MKSVDASRKLYIKRKRNGTTKSTSKKGFVASKYEETVGPTSIVIARRIAPSFSHYQSNTACNLGVGHS